jgi:hypothetical protein
VFGAVVAVLLLGWVTVRPALLNFGSTVAERQAAMPADDVVPDPRTTMTRSITLSGPPQAVWPWLVQMGVGRAGFYGYDWLENLGPAGLLDDIVNADRVHPEWQQLRVGDPVYPMPGPTPWRVTQLVPDRVLVIADDHAWSWAMTLTPVGDQTRLVTRMRWGQVHGVPGVAVAPVFDLGDVITEARALHGLEQRVDGTLPGMPGTRTGAPVPIARLPLDRGAALGWLLALAGLAAVAGRLLAARRDGWLVVLTVATTLAWCLWTDTDPWLALGHNWPLTTAALVIVVLAAAPLVRRVRSVPLPARLRAAVSAMCAAGLAVTLPALTLWDTATTLGATDTLAGRVAVTLVASAGAALTGVAFSRGARTTAGTVGAVGAGLVAAVTLATGNVLVGLLPVAALLPLRLHLDQSTTRARRRGDAARPHRGR